MIRANEPKNLVDGLSRPPYLFVEHELAPGTGSGYRRHPDDQRSFIVIGGRVRLETGDADPAHGREYGVLQGWHAPPAATYRFAQVGAEPAVVLEAGSAMGPTHESVDAVPEATSGAACVDVSSYRVDKPWGFEIWYTDNLADPPYALKQIHMTAGHQSSLQSHQQKVETNYVVDGEATVLNGAPAPDDPGSVIDADALPRQLYRRRSGWSSDAGILHRVIAQSDYTSIEVSTTELDDVIRWADDSNRGNGRIDTEHAEAHR
ncbi:hypothetical protein GA0074692_0972 [Micromonospora pallida]|uniref:Mannose-6-phosphate isomerase, cupin superfamily n=1 Tax=Micromonospora pallida TaxID=145854 RepID=A0A1C6RUA9_9ACTN|nr:hypothetical protein [Micromonospora pallida]SCL20755.1 hypothetical protein GA0074692_0972 [Micromonospora pallida]